MKMLIRSLVFVLALAGHAAAYEFTMGWTPGAVPADGFIIEMMDNAGQFREIGRVGGTVTGFKHAVDGAPGDSYTFGIVAFKAGWMNSQRLTATGIVPPLPEPQQIPAPTELRISRATQDEIQTRWRDNAMNEDRYKLVRTAMNGPAANLTAYLPANAQSYDDRGLRRNTRYCYCVSAEGRMSSEETCVCGKTAK